jgi:hypothetical protein
MVAGTTFTGVDPGPPFVSPRTTFDDRSPSPYPYDFISGNVLQVAGQRLRIDFAAPISGFGFGAALNSTFGVGTMRVDLYGANNQIIGSQQLTLDRTVLSQLGGTNSNSEGQFQMAGFATNSIHYAIIRNFGDPAVAASRQNWVIDNITIQQVPEPASLLTFGAGALALLVHRKRRTNN